MLKPRATVPDTLYDVLVIGAGFGGLGAALRASERGARVAICENLTYPGGCASTFTRSGYRFESGATLFSGFAADQLFGQWIARHNLEVEVDWLDPIVELRAPRYLPLLRAIGRPLSDLLARFGLAHFEPLRIYLDAVCQITVQCDTRSVEAPFALAAMDYYFRGTGHVRGGIGRLASALLGAIEMQGGEVFLANRVKGLTRRSNHWEVHTRRGTMRARTLVANLLPQAVLALLGAKEGDHPKLDALAHEVEKGWGAAMRYLVVRPPEEAADKATHLELVHDPSLPFINGNHVFCSVSAAHETERAPAGLRTMTVSTHVDLSWLKTQPGEVVAKHLDEVQANMHRTLLALAPEWLRDVAHDLTASPRTFERFVRRPGGFVGGVPRRVGLHHYTNLGLPRFLPGLFLVGDSVFPGQSTFATAIGGVRVANAITD